MILAYLADRGYLLNPLFPISRVQRLVRNNSGGTQYFASLFIFLDWERCWWIGDTPAQLSAMLLGHGFVRADWGANVGRACDSAPDIRDAAHTPKMSFSCGILPFSPRSAQMYRPSPRCFSI